MEASIDAALLATPSGRIISANEAASEVFGYSRVELCGQSCDSLIKSSRGALTKVLASLARPGVFRGEARCVRRDGTDGPAAISTAPTEDGHGAPCYIIIIRDHSELDEVQVHLQRSALRYQTITATTADGCWEVDSQGKILHANDRCCAMYGYDRAELVGMAVRNFEATRDPEQTAEHIREIMQFGFARFETKHRRKDGQLLEVEVSTTYQPDTGIFVAFLHDITARKRAHALLREAEERYRTLVDSLFDGTIIHQDGRIVSANAALAKTMGYSADELTTRLLLDLIAPAAKATAADLLQRHGDRSFTTTGQRKDGTPIPLEISSRACVVEGRESRMAVVRDLSERQRAELNQKKLQDQLIHAQKMESVGRLAGGVAHDFNNMLTAIQCNVSLALQNTRSGVSVREHLEQIQLCSQRSADLTRQLLAFARKETIAPRIVDLNALVAGALKMLNRIIGEEIKLVWHPQPELWRVKIDPSQVDQLLANLCVNARDAIRGAGVITIEVRNATFDDTTCANNPDAAAGDFVLLTVQDTGCGMTPEVMAQMFEPFFTTKKVGEGTGLGLATIYGIVKQNGGFIEVQSVPDIGSTFRLFLPRHAHEDATAQVVPPVLKPLHGRETVLVVEDERAILLAVRLALENLGYRVLSAANPRDALRLVATYQGKLDLLLTDVVMPEMTGRELAEKLVLQRPGLRVAYMSGYTANALSPRAVLENGMHFLKKPFSTEMLAAAVRLALA